MVLLKLNKKNIQKSVNGTFFFKNLFFIARAQEESLPQKK